MVSAGVQRITPGRWCDGTSDSLPANSHGSEEIGMTGHNLYLKTLRWR